MSFDVTQRYIQSIHSGGPSALSTFFSKPLITELMMERTICGPCLATCVCRFEASLGDVTLR